VDMLRLCKSVGRLFACIATLVVVAAAFVMLGAGATMVFNIATATTDKSRLVPTAPAFRTSATEGGGLREQPVTEVVRSEQPVTKLGERREQKQKKVASKQKPKPRFGQRRPYYSYSWGGGPYSH
jgi:hypothetical protein